MIRTQNLSKRYVSYPNKETISLALHPLSIEIAPGTVNVVVGQNGSGKTTLLSLIAGQIDTYGGTLEINGIKAPFHARKAPVAYAAEHPRFPDHWTVRNLLRFVGILQGLNANELEKKLPAIASQFGITHDLHRCFNSLSKGMQQRVNLAQSLLSNSELVIWDEPVSGLDWVFVEQVKKHLLQLKAESRTVIMSSHDLYLTRSIADHILHLQDGTLRFQGNFSEWTQWLANSSCPIDLSLLENV